MRITYLVEDDEDVPIGGLGDAIENFLDEWSHIAQVTVITGDGVGIITLRVLGTLHIEPDVITWGEVSQDIKELPLEHLATFGTIQSVISAINLWRAH